MASLVGKWEFVSAENLEGYMDALSIPDNLKQMAKDSKPVMEMSNSGDSWTLKTTVGDKVKDTTFKIGEDFETASLTGDALKCNVSMSGEKMVEIQKLGDLTIEITREVVGGQLVSNMTVKGVTATIKFNKA